jgi:hypothetical protein
MDREDKMTTKPSLIRIIDGIPTITLTEHEHILGLAIKQTKQEALLEAADAMEDGAFYTPYGLRRMAEELK